MGWEKRVFKSNQSVWANVDDDGQLVIENGRVAIRYQNEEGAKVYQASPQNIGGAATEKKASKSKSKKRTKDDIEGFDENIWENPAGECVVETTSRVDTEIAAPKPGEAQIYTDGACKTNPGPCGSGLVVVTEDDVIDIFQYVGIGTNNIGELFAIKLALDYCPDVTNLRIFTDSSYAIGVLDKGWKAKANKKLIETIKEQIADLSATLTFVKVKGHSGDPLNERADQLAVRSTESK